MPITEFTTAFILILGELRELAMRFLEPIGASVAMKCIHWLCYQNGVKVCQSPEGVFAQEPTALKPTIPIFGKSLFLNQ